MRTRWLEPLIIALGLTSLGFAGCKGDDEGGTENADEAGDGDGDSSSESAESTVTGDGDTTTGDDDDDTNCIPGELGCECNSGLCLGDLECTNGICSDPNCLPGELACECNDGLCLGDLVCMEGVCLEDSGTTTDSETDTTADTDTTSDTGMECPNPNEMMCDGVCVDVLANNDHCGECGVVCKVYVLQNPDVGICVEGSCTPTFSECHTQDEGFANCNEICAAEGKTCAETSCNDKTFIVASLMGCNNADRNAINVGLGACESFPPWNAEYGACCCNQ
jgi:hypothetical protein